MTLEAAEKLKAFFRAFAHSEPPLLLLDYDGTLAPFRRDRFKAQPWAGVRELLRQIQLQHRTSIHVISGRPAGEVTKLLALTPPPETWGLHGAERLYPDGTRELERFPAETTAKLDAVRDQLRRDSFGGLFEDKPNAAVVHWRGVPTRKAKEIEVRARTLFEPLAQADGLTLLKFEAGLELRAGRDKGGAVRAIVEQASERGPARIPVAFLGDDITDESAFQAVNALEGAHFTALVRRELRETAADAWLRPPRELLGFLQEWLEASAA